MRSSVRAIYTGALQRGSLHLLTDLIEPSLQLAVGLTLSQQFTFFLYQLLSRL